MDIKIALDRKNRTICQAVKNSSSEGIDLQALILTFSSFKYISSM